MLNLDHSFAIFPVLKSKRLILRELISSDAEALFTIYSDPQVMAGHGAPIFKTVAEAHQLIEWYAKAFDEKRAIRWAITQHNNDTVLGSCGFHHIVPVHHRAEIGYELASAYWRQGIMFEVVQAVARFGLAEMGLHRIEANVDPQNSASANLLRKAGFTEEGYLRERFNENGRFVDDWFFSILTSEIDRLKNK